MLPDYQSVAHFFSMNNKTLGNLVGDFTEADWRVRDGAGHTARWITGHVAAIRLRMVEMMGLPAIQADWTAAFGRGSSDADVPAGLDLAQVVQAFHEAQQKMAGRWEQLTPEDLAKPSSRVLPDGSNTIGGALRFLAWHEAYHLGQLGMLRRLAGKPGLA